MLNMTALRVLREHARNGGGLGQGTAVMRQAIAYHYVAIRSDLIGIPTLDKLLTHLDASAIVIETLFLLRFTTS